MNQTFLGMVSLDELKAQLSNLHGQKELINQQFHQVSGAINFTAHLISEMEKKALEALQKLKADEQQPQGDNNNATQEGEQPEGDISEHQDGDSCGEAQEPSDSDSLE
jgi:hypothetical protein